MDQWPLTADERRKFMAWVLMNNVPLSNDYDMEGFWKEAQNPLTSQVSASVNPNDMQIHYSDKYKLPNHPGFSTESKYYNPQTMPNTPSWVGGPIDTAQGRELNAESWSLRRPNGSVVIQEAPWFKTGILNLGN